MITFKCCLKQPTNIYMLPKTFIFSIKRPTKICIFQCNPNTGPQYSQRNTKQDN